MTSSSPTDTKNFAPITTDVVSIYSEVERCDAKIEVLHGVGQDAFAFCFTLLLCPYIYVVTSKIAACLKWPKVFYTHVIIEEWQ
jgi:hypothetical protein